MNTTHTKLSAEKILNLKKKISETEKVVEMFKNKPKTYTHDDTHCGYYLNEKISLLANLKVELHPLEVTRIEREKSLRKSRDELITETRNIYEEAAESLYLDSERLAEIKKLDKPLFDELAQIYWEVMREADI